MLDTPKTATTRVQDLTFRRMTRPQFLKAWKEGRLKDIYMGKAAILNRGIPQTITKNVVGELSQISEEIRHELQTVKNRKQGRAYQKDKGISKTEFDRIAALSQKPAEHVFVILGSYNAQHSDEFGPDVHFGIIGRKDRYYVEPN